MDKESLRQQFLDSNVDKNALFLTSCKSYGNDAVLELLYEMRIANDQLPEAAKRYFAEVRPDDLLGSFDALPKQNWEQVKFLRVQGPFLESEDKSIPVALVKDIFEKCQNLEHLALDNCGLDNDARLVEVAELLKKVGEKIENDNQAGRPTSFLQSLSVTNNNLIDERQKKEDPAPLGPNALRSALAYHKRLKVIDLSHNKFSHIVFGFHTWMQQSSVDREIRLIGNPAIEHSRLSNFSNLNFAKEIDELVQLPGTNIEEQAVKGVFGKLYVVRDNGIYLSVIKCTGVIPESLKALFSISSILKTCTIQDSGINDETLIACINAWTPEKIKEVYEINFDQNHISDEGAEALAEFITKNPTALPNLRKLSLKGNQITEKGQKALRDAFTGKDKLVLEF